MSDEISTSPEAAAAFKTTVNQLMSGLGPIVKRNDKGGAKMPSLSGLSNGNGITAIFENNLTPSQKLMFAQAWANGMDATKIIRRFIASTKGSWQSIETGNAQQQEASLLKIIDGLDVPGNGSQFLRQLYDKKEVLTDKERQGIVSYFKLCIYYAEMYQELVKEETGESL